MKALAVAAVAWLLWTALLFMLQRRMVFPGRDAPPLAPGERLRDAEPHPLALSGGVVESWWLAPAPGTPRPAPAIVFTHGNYEIVDEWVNGFEGVRAAGIGVLLVEFPGYGRSEGVATESTVAEAVVAAYDRVASLPGVDPARIVALGRSAGGGAAGLLSRRRPLAALVLSATFTGTRALASRYLVPGALVRNPLDNLGAVRAFPGPVLIQHGTHDRTIPYAHGQRLAAAATDGELLTYDCGHNDCPWDRQMEDLLRFLRERGILPPQRA